MAHVPAVTAITQRGDTQLVNSAICVSLASPFAKDGKVFWLRHEAA
jgi:hypothetical protein